MVAAYVTAMRRYATFRGRSTRGELWWFKLAMVAFCLDDGPSIRPVVGQ